MQLLSGCRGSARRRPPRCNDGPATPRVVRWGPSGLCPHTHLRGGDGRQSAGGPPPGCRAIGSGAVGGGSQHSDAAVRACRKCFNTVGGSSLQSRVNVLFLNNAVAKISSTHAGLIMEGDNHWNSFTMLNLT
jgi:hypothetical protein|eukprot:COSAG01_NODE_41198_length_454_cov_1.428169_1_plen_131_part_01